MKTTRRSTRLPFHRRVSVWSGLFVLLLIASSTSVLAKKEKSLAPSISPAPSSSHSPSGFPTKSPTASPTLEPTNAPSVSSAPSPSETPAPTSYPTGTPTLSPTGTPTAEPTRSETKTPTIAPTEYVNHVRLPTIGIDVIVSDQDSSSKSEYDLEADITAFIENVLETNSGVDTFDYVALDFDVIRSEFRQRRLSTGLSIRIDGTAYFGSNPPSAEDLAVDLRAYFGVWGIEDLENYLRVIGLPSSRIASVTIEGEAVKPASGTVGYNPGAKVQQPSTKTDPNASPGIIAGLAAACTVLAAVMIFLLAKSRRKTNTSSRPPSAQRGANVYAGNGVEAGALSPKSSQTQSAQISEEGDDAMSVGDCLSVDMSLYTTDESIVKAPPPPKPSYTYDPKRLDKVIAMAKSQSSLSKERVAI
jgi:hypothetical protein